MEAASLFWLVSKLGITHCILKVIFDLIGLVWLDIVQDTLFISDLNKTQITSSRQNVPRLYGSLSIHIPFVKSGKGTGADPMAIDCSERQVTAIQVAVS